MYAHYTNGSKTRPATLTIACDMSGREVIAVFNVPGRVAARKLAKEHNAQPWNF